MVTHALAGRVDMRPMRPASFVRFICTTSYARLQFRATLLCACDTFPCLLCACSFQSTCLHSGCPSLSVLTLRAVGGDSSTHQFQNCSWEAAYAGKASDHATYAGRVKGKLKQQRMRTRRGQTMPSSSTFNESCAPKLLFRS